MKLPIVLLTALLVFAAVLPSGCAATVAPAPTADDYDVIVEQRIDAVWRDTGLDDEARPDVSVGEPIDQFEASAAFASCMQQRAWPEYYVLENDNGFSYRAIELATTDAEKIDWFECFAAHPVDSTYTLGSEAQFDFIYDYFQDSLIPCLADNGFPVKDAPSRQEFHTHWRGWGDPLFPFLWNPYFDLPIEDALLEVPIEELCPPVPPNQDFYVWD